MTRLVVRDATVVSPEFGTFPADVVADNGVIVELVQAGRAPLSKDATVLDAHGLHLFPGFIDPHMHLGNYRAFEADTVSETRAAAAGGVTTLVSFLKEGRVSTAGEGYPALLTSARSIVDQSASVDVAFHAVVGGREHINQIVSLAKQGVRSFKFYMAYRNDPDAARRGTFGLDDALLLEGFRAVAAAEESCLAAVHCENDDICRSLFAARGREEMSFSDWEESRPSLAEAEAISRALILSGSTGCPLYVVHLSSREGLSVLDEARRRGRGNVFVEVTPHYLLLDREYCERLSNPAVAKTCPPIRSREDRDALWSGVARGSIDTIGSDHCAFDRGQKQDLLTGVPGFGSVEIYPSLLLSEAVRRGIDLERIAAVMSLRPAQILGLYPKKGSLRPGADADFAIFDLGESWTYKCEGAESAAPLSPYEGWLVQARLRTTVLRGRVVFDEDGVAPGQGRTCAVPA